MNPYEWDQRIKKLAKTVTTISNLAKSSMAITIPVIFDKVAVIIEPRILPITGDLFTWMVYLLAPKGWKFIFFTGTINHNIIQELIDKLHVNEIVELRNLEKENLTIKDYNLLLTSVKFWEDMPFENVLIFQTDTLLLDNDLDKFLKYDYVGAPWKKSFSWLHGPETHVVGNGGLSLRKRSGMIRATREIPYNGLNEDTYFCLGCKNILNIAPTDLAMQFSVETVFYSNPKGYHKCWNYISWEELVSVYKNIDDVVDTLTKQHLTIMPDIYTMDNRRLELLLSIAHARHAFLGNARLYRRRDQITTLFLENESSILSAWHNLGREPVTITFPVALPQSFMDNVLVVPSAQQIAYEVQDHTSQSQQNCSICQDSIVSGGAILRTCQHVYHRSCIQTWFGASVRCPVCRRDIREGQASQTSSGATGTQAQEMYQWGGAESPE